MDTLNGIFRINQRIKFFLLLIVLLIVNSSFLFRNTPPGTICIKSLSLYVDRNETSNFHWSEYLSYIRNKHGVESKEYQNILPNMEVWQQVYPGWHLIEKMSGRTEERNMPIVGISHEQAIIFCKWRSEQVYKNTKMHVEYRLPTKQEWDEIAKYTLKANHLSLQKELIQNKDNGNKIQHLQDNVAEMVAEQGVVKGLYLSYLKNNPKVNYSDIFIDRKHEDAMPYVGFRCVATIIK